MEGDPGVSPRLWAAAGRRTQARAVGRLGEAQQQPRKGNEQLIPPQWGPLMPDAPLPRPLTICRKALESLVREKERSGTQRGTSPSVELARARCNLARMAFSSFCRATGAVRGVAPAVPQAPHQMPPNSRASGCSRR